MDLALVFMPLVAAAIAGLFGRFIGERGAQAVTCLAHRKCGGETEGDDVRLVRNSGTANVLQRSLRPE